MISVPLDIKNYQENSKSTNVVLGLVDTHLDLKFLFRKRGGRLKPLRLWHRIACLHSLLCALSVSFLIPNTQFEWQSCWWRVCHTLDNSKTVVLSRPTSISSSSVLGSATSASIYRDGGVVLYFVTLLAQNDIFPYLKVSRASGIFFRARALVNYGAEKYLSASKKSKILLEAGGKCGGCYYSGRTAFVEPKFC